MTEAESAEVRAAVAALSDTAAWCAALLDRVELVVVDAADEWSGESARAFHRLQREWLVGAREMVVGAANMRPAAIVPVGGEPPEPGDRGV